MLDEKAKVLKKIVCKKKFPKGRLTEAIPIEFELDKPDKKEKAVQLLPSSYGSIFKNSYTVTAKIYYALGMFCISEPNA